MTSSLPSRTRRDGCGFTIATAVFTCLFLVINGIALTASYGVLAEYGPGLLQRDKVKQLILFVGPVLLVFVEWTIVDWLGRWLFHTKTKR